MRVLTLCLFLLISSCGGFSAENQAVVQVKTYLGASGVHPGFQAKLAVVARIAPGYHINDHKPSREYLIRTEIVFAKSSSWRAEKVVYPHGTPRKFAFLDTPISVYEGEERFGALLRFSRSLRPGTYKLHGNLDYQACNDHACLPPAKVPFAATVRVVPGSTPVKPANSAIFEKINFR